MIRYSPRRQHAWFCDLPLQGDYITKLSYSKELCLKIIQTFIVTSRLKITSLLSTYRLLRASMKKPTRAAAWDFSQQKMNPMTNMYLVKKNSVFHNRTFATTYHHLPRPWLEDIELYTSSMVFIFDCNELSSCLCVELMKPIILLWIYEY